MVVATAGAVVAVVIIALVVVLSTRRVDGPSAGPSGSTSGSTGSTSGSTGSTSGPTSGSTSPSGSPSGGAIDDPDDPAYDAALSTPREDSYYGLHGDPGVDALHYDLDLTWVPTTRTLTGDVTIALRAATTADHLQLDLLHDYRVSSVTVDGTAAGFTLRRDDLLEIRHPVTRDQRYSVEIRYAGTPRHVWAPSQRDDLQFVGMNVTPQGGLWTMQEPFGAYTWYPVNDQPSDKALYDFTLHVPSTMVAVANGQLTSQSSEDGQTVMTWHLDRPAASYLVTLAVGDYVETKATGPGGVPITYWTPRGDAASLAKLQVTPSVMAWNEAHLGPYPFSSLGLVVVPSDSAMETETMITLGHTAYTRSAPVIQHEMSHQWYGDMVTPTDWKDLWMNEGMAMFTQLAYEADRAGVPIDKKVRQQKSYEAYVRFQGGPPAAYKKGDFGDGNVYYGPATMWNDLRHRMGDAKFWAMVKKWPTVHPYGNATRQQYFRWLEQDTGLRLGPFLHAWLLGKNTPKDVRIP